MPEQHLLMLWMNETVEDDLVIDDDDDLDLIDRGDRYKYIIITIIYDLYLI